MNNCFICKNKNSTHCCSSCFIPFCGVKCFSQHELICGGVKRNFFEVSDEQVERWFRENNVDKIRELLENDNMPTNMISLRYAKSLEMANLLLMKKADPSEYIGNGRIALDECMNHFDVRPLLPRGSSKTRDLVETILEAHRLHIAVCSEMFPEKAFKLEFVRNKPDPRTDLFARMDKMKKDKDGFLAQLKKTFPYVTYSVMLSKEMDYDDLFNELIYQAFYPDPGSSESFFPEMFSHIELPQLIENTYLRRFNQKTLNFWYGKSNDFTPKYDWWLRYSVDQIQTRIKSSPESFSLVMNGLFDKVFKQSRRAKTEMEMFRTADSKSFHSDDKEVVPVTRYSLGMHTGLFFDEKPNSDKVCGTYYYVEPESSVFLKYTKALVAKDKRHAAELLEIKSLKSKEESTEERTLRLGLLENESFMFTPMELITFVQKNNIPRKNRLSFIVDGPNSRLDGVQMDRKYFCAHLLNVYALQDFLDQPICNAAAKAGYDIIILTHMVGSRQMVPEVVDVRSRNESFANLHF